MSYSSGDLGTSIDYFVYQECILIVLHIVIAAFGLSYFNDEVKDCWSMNYLILCITLMEVSKTILMFWFWTSYQPGLIRNFFDRLPSRTFRIFAALAIHGILDIMQSAATVFTMWLAWGMKFLLKLCTDGKRERDSSPSHYWSVTLFIFRIDLYWCQHLFATCDNDTVRENCLRDMDCLKR